MKITILCGPKQHTRKNSKSKDIYFEYQVSVHFLFKKSITVICIMQLFPYVGSIVPKLIFEKGNRLSELKWDVESKVKTLCETDMKYRDIQGEFDHLKKEN